MLRFFPANGYRRYTDGSPVVRGREGSYWSSSSSNAPNAWRLWFNTVTIDLAGGYHTYGFSVRCVAQKEFSNYMLLLIVLCI